MAHRGPAHVPVKEPIAITCHLARGDRQYFAGETFRATLRFRNDAPYPLERLTYHIEMQVPSLRRVVLHKSTAPELRPGEQREAVVEYRFSEPNEYYFRVSVAYSDFTGEQKSHNASPLRLMAPKALDEAVRRVHALPIEADPPMVAAAASPSVPELTTGTKYLASIGIVSKAPTGTALRLTAVRFVPRDPSVIVISQPAVGRSPIARTSHGEALPTAAAAVGREELAPNDIIRFVAEVALRGGASSLSSSVNKPGGPHPPSDAIFFSSSAASVSKTHTDLGHFEWEWERDPDISGADASAVYRIPRGAPEPEVGLQVLSVYPPAPAVGDAVTLTLLVSNNHPTEKRDVSLVAHVPRLLPHFAYSGPLLTAIGTVAPRSSALTYAHLVAHYPGFCPLVGAFELRDTARPEVTLWPVFPTAAAATGGASAAAGALGQQFIGTGLGTAQRPDAQTPMMNITAAEGWPPRLADIFVTYPDDGDSDSDSDGEANEGEAEGAVGGDNSESL